MTTIESPSRVRQQHVAVDDGRSVDVCVYADDERVSVTAWDEDGALIGIAWVDTADVGGPLEAAVEVTPPQRRRGIGTVLVRELIAEASSLGISTMTWTTPADDLAARRVVESAGAVCARRVDHGRAKSTFFVPAGTSAA